MSELTDFRAAKDDFFAGPHSPIEHDGPFPGLAYFPETADLRFELKVEPVEESSLSIGTSDGQSRTYDRAGTVRFVMDGTEVQLTLLSHGSDGGYFLPFRDATSGKETYGAGRYLDLEPGEGSTVTIDFNLAYNPYCAYSDAYSCPLPPTENWLQIPITAGELTFAES